MRQVRGWRRKSRGRRGEPEARTAQPREVHARPRPAELPRPGDFASISPATRQRYWQRCGHRRGVSRVPTSVARAQAGRGQMRIQDPLTGSDPSASPLPRRPARDRSPRPPPLTTALSCVGPPLGACASAAIGWPIGLARRHPDRAPESRDWRREAPRSTVASVPRRIRGTSATRRRSSLGLQRFWASWVCGGSGFVEVPARAGEACAGRCGRPR
jgi:hypothetical protein